MKRMKEPRQESVQPPWRPITRRAFAALLGMGALAFVSRTKTWAANRSRVPSTRWIGHC